MGLEAQCEARFGGKASPGKARLEEKELVFRGDFRLRIPFKDMRSFEARNGRLAVGFPGGVAVFHLGAQAEKWALKIRYPRSLLDKLGVKPGSRVAVLGIEGSEFRRQLRERGAEISEGKVKPGSDTVIVSMSKKSELKKLSTLRKAIKPDGAIWVVWPKGRPAFREDDVRKFGPKAGLVDVKVLSFSETLSALKMVIPIRER